MKEQNNPSKAEHLANILTGNGESQFIGATVQRSHRFHLDQFIKIENMAKLADCSVAAMINQVVEVGIEAVCEHLPKDFVQQMRVMSQEQFNKANSNAREKVGTFKAKK